jgi:hypothetical protein
MAKSSPSLKNPGIRVRNNYKLTPNCRETTPSAETGIDDSVCIITIN